IIFAHQLYIHPVHFPLLPLLQFLNEHYLQIVCFFEIKFLEVVTQTQVAFFQVETQVRLHVKFRPVAGTSDLQLSNNIQEKLWF
ncbi:MAG: hypothetical protein ACK56F_08420, partial [bacterium]